MERCNKSNCEIVSGRDHEMCHKHRDYITEQQYCSFNKEEIPIRQKNGVWVRNHILSLGERNEGIQNAVYCTSCGGFKTWRWNKSHITKARNNELKCEECDEMVKLVIYEEELQDISDIEQPIFNGLRRVTNV